MLFHHRLPVRLWLEIPARPAGGRLRRTLFIQNFLYVGVPYFRPWDYHQAQALSLLCSEWEEVVHTWVKHRQIKSFVCACSECLPRSVLCSTSGGSRSTKLSDPRSFRAGGGTHSSKTPANKISLRGESVINSAFFNQLLNGQLLTPPPPRRFWVIPKFRNLMDF